MPARAAVGDRARQQLLDRPVDDRHDHEHDRPQQRDVLVALVAVEHMRGEREVGERDDAGRRDPDRQDPRAAAVLRAWRARAGSATTAGRAASSTETASAPGRPPVARQQLHEAALGPVVEVPGRVAEVLAGTRRGPCSARATAARAGPRPAGARGRRAPSRRPCARGRARARAPRSPIATSNSPSANGRFSAFMTWYSRFGAWRSSHSLVQQRVVEVDADDAPLAEALRPLVRQHALAAADVEQRLAARPASKSSSSVRSKPAISRLTTGWSSRTCRRCCR